jgi:hypothetical protein
MRGRFLNRDVLAALLMLAVALGAYESVRAGGTPGEKIQFSDVPAAGPGANPVVVSNVNRLTTTESSFKQVKEDLMRPFSSLDPRNAMMDEGMNQPLPMSQRPAPMSRRTLEMLDKKRNWMFTSYQELFMPQDDVAKQMFGIKEYGADGREKRQDSVVESYYESLGNKNEATNSRSMEEARALFLMQTGFDPYGKKIHADGAFTQTTFQFESPDSIVDKSESSAQPGAASLTNLTSTLPPGLGMQTRRQSEVDDIRRSILGSAATPIYRPGQENNTLLTPDDIYSQKIKSPADTLLSQQMVDANSTKVKSANPYLVADPTANVLHSHINDDLTAKALGLPQPSLAATNNYYTRPPSTAQSIEAEHDPFGANRPKRGF